MANDERTSCWTCRYLVLDITKGYHCTLNGRHLAERNERYDINKPNDCHGWRRA